MEVALFLIVVVVFAYLGDVKITGKKSLYFRIVLILVLSFLPWVIGELSTDHESYADNYRAIGRLDHLEIGSLYEFFFGRMEKTEYGFILINRILYKLGVSQSGFFMVMALLTNTLFVKAYYRFEQPAFVFFLLLCSSHYIVQANLVRQILSVSIVLYSLRYVVEKEWKKYLLVSILTFAIHHSSILSFIFLPLCFFSQGFKYIKWTLLGIWVLSILVAFGRVFLDLSQLNLLAGASEGYDFYLNSENGIGTSNESFNFLYNFLVILFIFFYKSDEKKNVYAYVFLLGAIFCNLYVAVPNLYRVSLYFSAIYPAFVPFLLKQGQSFRKFKFAIQGLTVIIVLYYVRTYFLLMSFGDSFSIL